MNTSLDSSLSRLASAASAHGCSPAPRDSLANTARKLTFLTPGKGSRRRAVISDLGDERSTGNSGREPHESRLAPIRHGHERATATGRKTTPDKSWSPKSVTDGAEHFFNASATREGRQSRGSVIACNASAVTLRPHTSVRSPGLAPRTPLTTATASSPARRLKTAHVGRASSSGTMAFCTPSLSVRALQHLSLLRPAPRRRFSPSCPLLTGRFARRRVNLTVVYLVN